MPVNEPAVTRDTRPRIAEVPVDSIHRRIQPTVPVADAEADEHAVAETAFSDWQGRLRHPSRERRPQTAADVVDLRSLDLPPIFLPADAALVLRGLGLAEMTECALKTRAYRKQVPFHLNGRRIIFTLEDLRQIAKGEGRRATTPSRAEMRRVQRPGRSRIAAHRAAAAKQTRIPGERDALTAAGSAPPRTTRRERASGLRSPPSRTRSHLEITGGQMTPQRRPKPWAEARRHGTRYVWRFEGEKYRTPFYEDPEEARADAMAQITEQMKGTWRDRSGPRILLEEWIDIWAGLLDDIEPTTRAKYKYFVEFHILPAFQGRQIGSLTFEEIEAWDKAIPTQISARGRPYAASVASGPGRC